MVFRCLFMLKIVFSLHFGWAAGSGWWAEGRRVSTCVPCNEHSCHLLWCTSLRTWQCSTTEIQWLQEGEIAAYSRNPRKTLQLNPALIYHLLQMRAAIGRFDTRECKLRQLISLQKKNTVSCSRVRCKAFGFSSLSFTLWMFYESILSMVLDDGLDENPWDSI